MRSTRAKKIFAGMQVKLKRPTGVSNTRDRQAFGGGELPWCDGLRIQP